MRLADLIYLPLIALWQQKVRTLLTTLGVVFGSYVLAASLSIGQGVQNTFEKLAERSNSLRKVSVTPGLAPSSAKTQPVPVEVKGNTTDEKRERIREALSQVWRPNPDGPRRLELSADKLKELAAIPHVETVVPIVNQYGFAIIDGHSERMSVGGVRPDDEDCQRRLLIGRSFESSGEKAALVSEFLLYQMGFVDDADVNQVVGKTLRLEFESDRRDAGLMLWLSKSDYSQPTREENLVLEKIRNKLPEILPKLDLSPADQVVLNNAIQPAPAPKVEPFAKEFEIVGVVRERTKVERNQSWDPLQSYSSVLLPYQSASDLFFEIPGHEKLGVENAIVIVDRNENAKVVVEEISAAGVHAQSLLEHIERERLMYLMIFAGMTCVATVALLVAALGITNTMLMSVLERTREIGIMKAVGAGNGQLLFMFLAEGALIGTTGGVIGLLLAWGSSFPGDSWVRSMVMRDLKIELKDSIFLFPPWLAAVVVMFAVLVTTVAAVFPARRAAKIDPVRALRHE
jgi:putative ABC transport system permease protein